MPINKTEKNFHPSIFHRDPIESSICYTNNWHDALMHAGVPMPTRASPAPFPLEPPTH